MFVTSLAVDEAFRLTPKRRGIVRWGDLESFVTNSSSAIDRYRLALPVRFSEYRGSGRFCESVRGPRGNRVRIHDRGSLNFQYRTLDMPLVVRVVETRKGRGNSIVVARGARPTWESSNLPRLLFICCAILRLCSDERGPCVHGCIVVEIAPDDENSGRRLVPMKVGVAGWLPDRGCLRADLRGSVRTPTC